MAKRRGPGRPPNKRGPGRPKGSKNKSKRRVRPSVLARHNEPPAAEFFLGPLHIPKPQARRPVRVALPPPKRGRGRPRNKDKALAHVPPVSIDELRRVRASLLDEIGMTREEMQALKLGVTDAIQAAEARIKQIADDTEHPTTQTLARRLIDVEGFGQMAKSAYVRLEHVENQVRELRRAVEDLAHTARAARNLADVRKLAGPDDPDNADQNSLFEDNADEDPNADHTRAAE